MKTIVKSYEDAYGTATPVIQRMMEDYVRDLGADLVHRVIEVTAQAGGRTWAYLAKSLDSCKASGMDLEAYEAEQVRRKAGRNVVVDRLQPSDVDILQRAARRPLRLKREE